MSLEAQRTVSFAFGVICVAACFQKRFFGGSIGGRAGREVGPWSGRAFLILGAAFFFWAAVFGIK